MNKRRKSKNYKLIFISIILASFFVSNAYATLSDTLTISGTANIKYNEAQAVADHEIYEPMQETKNYSNCKYTYKNVSNWQQANGTYIYEIQLSIINLDKDYTNGNLEISFEEKQGLAKEQTKDNLGILQAKQVLITGNKITALLTEENSKVNYGEKINLSIYLTYENIQQNGIEIENVTLNGNKLTEEKEELEKANSDTNMPVNELDKFIESTDITENEKPENTLKPQNKVEV